MLHYEFIIQGYCVLMALFVLFFFLLLLLLFFSHDNCYYSGVNP